MSVSEAQPPNAPRYADWQDYFGSAEASAANLADQEHCGRAHDGAEPMVGVDAVATAHASWSLTLYAALERLRLLPSQNGEAPQDHLLLHVLGADSREGTTPAQLAASFAPLATLLAGECAVLQCVIIGPNVPAAVRGRHEIPPFVAGQPALELHLECGLFHELVAAGAEWLQPPLATFCLNAGLWGYDSWAESLSLILGAGASPLVVTSYNAHEAEDDLDALELLPAPGVLDDRLLQDREDWLWLPEANPFRSLCSRNPSAVCLSSLPQQENHFWQCISVRGGDPGARTTAWHEHLRAQAQQSLGKP